MMHAPTFITGQNMLTLEHERQLSGGNSAYTKTESYVSLFASLWLNPLASTCALLRRSPSTPPWTLSATTSCRESLAARAT